MDFKEIVKARYATKKFTGEKLPQEKIDELLEIVQLSASSYGLQPYVIHVIENQELKEKLKPASYGQEQITTCSHLLVFCGYSDINKRIDQYQEMMENAGASDEGIKNYINIMRNTVGQLSKEDGMSWAVQQAYIALGNAINGAKALGFDSCPMEGFDNKQYIEILELTEDQYPAALVAVGVAADEPRDKLRYSKEKLFEWHSQ